MFERILVTGYSGFVGPWVLAELRRNFPTAKLYGAARHRVGAEGDNGAPDQLFSLDLRSSAQIEAVITAVRPDAVVHLASLRLASLDELLAVNVVGCERLLAHLNKIVPEARTLIVGSSSELGRAAELDVPLDEEALCHPVDFYGITKLAQSSIARRQALHGQDVVLLRPFNLVGPFMPDSLLAGRCVQQLRAAARATGPVELEFGPLDTHRDYLDVRDFSRAIALALEKSPSGMLYHIGSGISRSGHDLVKALIRESGLRNVAYKVVASSGRSLVPWQTANISRAAAVLGWRPTISWRRSIRDIGQAPRAPEGLEEIANYG
jgi:nucleoside-diphosphate-sugar epimerase